MSASGLTQCGSASRLQPRASTTRLLRFRPLAVSRPGAPRSASPKHVTLSRRGGVTTVVRSAAAWSADAAGEADDTRNAQHSEQEAEQLARVAALRQRREVVVAGNQSTDTVLWAHAASRSRDGRAASSQGPEGQPTPTPTHPLAAAKAMLPVAVAAVAVSALVLLGGGQKVNANVVERWGSTFNQESFTEPASFSEKLSYKTQKIFAMPLYYRLAVLVVVSTAAVCLGGLLYMTITKSKWNESVFQSYMMLNNVPGADASGDADTPGTLVMSNVLYLIGLFTFALLIGIVSDAVSEKVEDVRHGNHQVLERNHTVILNWNDSMIPLLRQLATAQEESNGRQDLKHIVILADKDKAEMDDDVESMVLEDHSNVEIITRSGVPYTLSNLKKVAVWDADNVIVLQPQSGDEKSKTYEHSSKMATTVYGLHQHAKKKQNVVIEMPLDKEDKALLENACDSQKDKSYQQVYPEELLAKVAAQCSLQPGLANVFGELLVQSTDGAEFYFETVGKVKGLTGRTFGETWRRFQTVALVGVLPQEGAPNLAPSEQYVLRADDRLIFVADDEKQIKKISSADATSTYTTGEEWSAQKMAKRQKEINKKPKVQNIVMLGCNARIENFLNGLDEFAYKGTRFTLVSETEVKLNPKDYPNLKIKVIQGSPLDPANLEAAKVREASSVRIVSATSELSDSDVLPILGLLGNKFKLAQDGNRSHVLVELIDDQNTPMAHNIASTIGMKPSKVAIRVNDSLLSGMISQVTANPLLQSVLMELTRAEGAEFYLTPVEKVLELPGGSQQLSFGEVTARVRALTATTLGYVDADGLVTLNPDKESKRVYQPGDKLIVIAEDEI